MSFMAVQYGIPEANQGQPTPFKVFPMTPPGQGPIPGAPSPIPNTNTPIKPASPSIQKYGIPEANQAQQPTSQGIQVFPQSKPPTSGSTPSQTGSSFAPGSYQDVVNQALQMSQNAVNPAVQSLQSGINTTNQIYGNESQQVLAGVNPLKDRYNNLINQIKGNQQLAENRQTTTTNNELARRGILSNTGLGEQEITNAVNPITQQYTGMIQNTGSQEESDIKALQDQAANILNQGALSGVNTQGQIAQLLAGAGQSGIAQGSNLYQSNLQNALAQQQMAQQQSQFGQNLAQQQSQFGQNLGVQQQQLTADQALKQQQLAYQQAVQNAQQAFQQQQLGQQGAQFGQNISLQQQQQQFAQQQAAIQAAMQQAQFGNNLNQQSIDNYFKQMGINIQGGQLALQQQINNPNALQQLFGNTNSQVPSKPTSKPSSPTGTFQVNQTVQHLKV